MIMLHEGRQKIDLSGIWLYRTDETLQGEALGFQASGADVSAWKPIKVPNNWYLTEIGDYFGTVWFRTSFPYQAGNPQDKVFLRFGAVDYYADVWLNDVYLGSHEGIFNPFEFDVTGLLRPENNVLIVKDGAPRDETEYINAGMDKDTPLSEKYQRHQARAITQIKGHMIDAMHRPGSMTAFRQDGNSAGIWDEVALVIRPEVFIAYCKITTKTVLRKDWQGDGKDKPTGDALVCLDITVSNTTGATVSTAIEALIAPANFAGDELHRRRKEIVIPPGSSTFKFVLTVKDAKLWWTWDHGFPHLYSLRLRMARDEVTMRFGIKDIEYDEKYGKWYLNGKRIFLRGMRYISSLWMSEANKEMWQADFDKMVRMNINAIRIGSHVEKDGVYRICDELGLLMWQVFPLHYCVSDDDDLIMRASDMIRDMGYMLTNHACMGMWSVYKEPEIYFLPDKPNNYFRLCQILKETLKSVDPTRWVHLGDYREGVMNIMTGCCSDGDTNVKDKIIPPNIVEFGSQSLPCLETLKTFIPEEKLWPITDWDLWEYWGLFYSNTFKFAKVEIGNSIEEFISNTQEYEAVSVKEQIEFLRQRKYNPVGTMYLYYWSDACPMIGSGLLDYYRRPYKVYDAMQMVYTPVLISLEPCMTPYVLGRKKVFRAGESFTARVWIINDHYHPVDRARIRWEIVDQNNGRVVREHDYILTLQEDSAEIADHIIWPAPAEEAGNGYRIKLSVTADDGAVLSQNYFDFTLE